MAATEQKDVPLNEYVLYNPSFAFPEKGKKAE
jgi:hypothetical protein